MNNEINVEEAKSLIDNGAVVLDVRTEEEYKGGHIKNSININIHGTNFEEKTEKLEKSKKYVVYCLSGNRSLNAVNIMHGLGFDDTHSMVGGIIDWKKEGLEVVE